MNRRIPVATAVAVAVLALAACGGDGDELATTDEPTTQDDGDEVAATECDGEVEPGTVTVFAHEGSEVDAYRDALDAFNETVGKELGVVAEVTFIPEGGYTDQVNAAAASGSLPAVLDVDGPTMANYAWAGSLVPIDSCISDAERANLLPSIIEQGTYADRLWAVGSFDSGVGLYAYRSALEQVGARIPTSADDAWTADEFTTILTDLKSAGYEHPFDARIWASPTSEWYPYAFAPIIWSAGGDLIDRETGETADGFLNTPDVVQALTTFQSWITDGLVNTEAADDSDFLAKKSVLSWNGHWGHSAFAEAIGDDLVVLPLPDFGAGARAPMGSWAWGITPAATDPDAAWAVVSYLISDDAVKAITDVNSAVPGTKSVIATSQLYKADGPLSLFVQELEAAPDIAVPRPVTPAYTTITMVLRTTLGDIFKGGDVQGALDAAVSEIDADIEANQGYPVP